MGFHYKSRLLSQARARSQAPTTRLDLTPINGRVSKNPKPPAVSKLRFYEFGHGACKSLPTAA